MLKNYISLRKSPNNYTSEMTLWFKTREQISGGKTSIHMTDISVSGTEQFCVNFLFTC